MSSPTNQDRKNWFSDLQTKVEFLEAQVKAFAEHQWSAAIEKFKTEFNICIDCSDKNDYMIFETWTIQTETIILIYRSYVDKKIISLEFETYHFMLGLIHKLCDDKELMRKLVVDAHLSGQDSGISRAQTNPFASADRLIAENYLKDLL